MTDNKNAVKNLAEVIRERSEVIAELIVACVSATKTFSYGVSDSKEQEKDCAMVKQAVPEEPAIEEEVEVVKTKKKKVSSTRKEREEAEVLPEEITEESLAEVSYNGLKKLAKDLGVSASGDRETLTANILASVSEDEVEEEEDSEEEVTSSEEEIEDAEFSEEDEDEDEDEDNEEEEDSLAEQIEQATKDMTVEELADLLVSYKLPAKGKRQALIDAIIKGVEDGIIEFNTGDDVDEEEDEEEEEIDDAETVEEEVDDSPRGKAVQDLKDSIEAEFEEGSISRKDLITYINKRMGTKNRMKTVDDADLLAKYCELQATLIDDEGDLHEEKEPYVLNGEYHCCGEALQKDEDGDLVCPICGTCYDGEE